MMSVWYLREERRGEEVREERREEQIRREREGEVSPMYEASGFTRRNVHKVKTSINTSNNQML